MTLSNNPTPKEVFDLVCGASLLVRRSEDNSLYFLVSGDGYLDVKDALAPSTYNPSLKAKIVVDETEKTFSEHQLIYTEEIEGHEKPTEHKIYCIPLQKLRKEVLTLDLMFDRRHMDEESRILVGCYLLNISPTAGFEELAEKSISSVEYLYLILQMLQRVRPNLPILEMKFANRWYPVNTTCEMHYTFFGKNLIIETSIAVAKDIIWEEHRSIYGGVFQSPDLSGSLDLKPDQALAASRIRICKGLPEGWTDLLQKADLYQQKTGLQVNTTAEGIALINTGWGTSLKNVNCGTPEQPHISIIDYTPEYDRSNRNEAPFTKLPFVRGFSLKTRSFSLVDIRDLHEYQYDTQAIERLVMPAERKDLITRVMKVASSGAPLVSDLLANRHGGVVILACGPTGTGKTLTAEVCSEYLKRPIYMVQVNDIGVQPQEVDLNLRRLLDRAVRWNAILLIDEADVFVSARGEDINQAAIVSIFLRLLDYYNGILFMTTNRETKIDDAILSRTALLLHYKALKEEQRLSIWKNLLANVKDLDISNILKWVPQLAKLDLNGRQIRNCLRIMVITQPKTLKDAIALVKEISSVTKKTFLQKFLNWVWPK